MTAPQLKYEASELDHDGAGWSVGVDDINDIYVSAYQPEWGDNAPLDLQITPEQVDEFVGALIKARNVATGHADTDAE